MTSQMSSNICHGTASIIAEDKDRAEAAALTVLAGVDPVAAYEEFQRQWIELDDTEAMTGDALLWVKAQEAADIALTEGWHNPAGAGCEISA